jgi:MraZ protein
MFRGNHPARVEESGRVKLPTAFKETADQHNITAFYVTSTDGASAEIWPLNEWEKVEQALTAEGTLDELTERFMTATSYYGQEVKMDAQGRFVLPQLLRVSAKLSGDVAVVGKTKYLEIYNLETIEQTIKASPVTKEERNRIALASRRTAANV